MERELRVEPTSDQLVGAVVEQLVPVLERAQHEHGRAALALTAGSIMEQVWAALAASDAGRALDWSRVDVFWGDERFVASGSADRNDVPADRILFGHAPFSASVRYPMPAADGDYGDDIDAAAAGYAATLRGARRTDDTGEVPAFDVVLLGIGPDGHCCSLFPNHPSSAFDGTASVIAVRNSPKPPPLRLSLSFAGLNTANEIWVVASGSGKADAAARAFGGAARTEVPSAGAQGRQRTLWLLDSDAASKLPRSH